MKLSKNLTLAECLRSQTAKRLGIKNEPHEEWVKVVEKIVTKDKKQLTLDPTAERTFKSSKYYPKLLKMYDDCDF